MLIELWFVSGAGVADAVGIAGPLALGRAIALALGLGAADGDGVGIADALPLGRALALAFAAIVGRSVPTVREGATGGRVAAGRSCSGRTEPSRSCGPKNESSGRAIDASAASSMPASYMPIGSAAAMASLASSEAGVPRLRRPR